MITKTISVQIPFKNAFTVIDSPYILNKVHGHDRWTFGDWVMKDGVRIRRGKIIGVDVPEPFRVFTNGRPTLTCGVKQTILSMSDTSLRVSSTLKPKLSGIASPAKNKTYFSIRDDGCRGIVIDIESENVCYLPPPFKRMATAAMDALSDETLACLEDACYDYVREFYG